MGSSFVDHSDREITEPTRRNIADELIRRNMTLYGRLDEHEFFSRVFKANDFATSDSGEDWFGLVAEIWQHRDRNPDWPHDWWVTDDRFDLLHTPDETFLRVLAEVVHPMVRPDAAQRAVCLELFNKHLAPEGWEIGVVSQLGAHAIYGGRRVEQLPRAVGGEARQLGITLGEYVIQQITRMEAALPDDPDLAIGTAKEFIETICRTVLQERGLGTSDNDDVPGLVRLTVKSLPVVPRGIEHPTRWEKVVGRLVNNLSSLGRSLAELRNAFGTGHGQPAGHVGLDTHHAQLAVRMATALGVFLYEVHDRNPPFPGNQRTRAPSAGRLVADGNRTSQPWKKKLSSNASPAGMSNKATSPRRARLACDEETAL